MKSEKIKRDDIFLLLMKMLFLCAFIVSIILTVYAVYQSTLAGAESSESARPIIDAVKIFFGIDDTVIPQSIEIDKSKLEKQYYFSGSKVKLSISAKPADADAEVEYEFFSNGKAEENCFVDSEGYIVYNGIEKKDIEVTVRSKYDRNIKSTVTISYLGLSPASDAVEDISIKFFNEKGGEELNTLSLRVGQKYYTEMIITVKDEYLENYGLSEKEISVGMLPNLLIATESSSGKSFESDTDKSYLMFSRDFDGTLTYKLKDTKTSYFSEIDGNENINPKISVSVKKDGDYNYKPETTPSLLTDSFDDFGIEYQLTGENEYLITVPENIEDIKFSAAPMGEDVNVSGKLVFADNESKNAAEIVSNETLRRKVNNGEFNLYWVSLVDENLKMKIKVVYEGYTPNKIEIYGKNAISKGGIYSYSAAFDKEIYNEKDIKWSIVKGENIANFEDGALTATGIGNVVLRAESVYYPNVSAELVIKIRLWDSFSGFARKMLGHFLLFLLLGQSYFICYLFLIKKRKLAFFLAPLTLISVSAITELIQLGVPERAGTIEDVLINFSGGICGILSILLIFTVFALLLKKLSPHSFEKLKRDFEKISFSEILKKQK